MGKGPPSDPPASGTLLLFDRNISYKKDGHNYVKKRNTQKVREDHVKLMVNGKRLVAGSYVHSTACDTFHRRAYRLLDPNTGVTKTPVQKKSEADSDGEGNMIQSLVLLHYLDTRISDRTGSGSLIQAKTKIDCRPSTVAKRRNVMKTTARKEMKSCKARMVENHNNQKEIHKRRLLSEH